MKSGRERVFVVASGLALLVALLAGIWTLQRARTVWDTEQAAAERTELLARRDALRGAVAEQTSLRRLTTVPRSHPDAAALRAALRDAARAFQEDPLEGNPDAGIFGCVALEVSSGDGGLEVWTSGPIDPADRSWCLTTLSEGAAERGSDHVADAARLLGVAWAAFDVGGTPRIGALAWLSPRSR